MNSGAGVQGSPYSAGKPRTGHRVRAPKRAVTAKELSPVAAHGPGRLVHVEERGTSGELRVVWVPPEKRAGLGVDFGAHMHRRFWPQVSQHPFHVPSGRESAGPARFVFHL